MKNYLSFLMTVCALTLSSSLSAFAVEPQVNVTFTDTLNRPTSVLVQSSNEVVLTVDGLGDKEKLFVDLWVRPVGSDDRGRRLEIRNWKLTPNSSGHGLFHWDVKFPGDVFEPQAQPLWQVEAQWRTARGAHGLALDVVFLAGPASRSYFEVLERENCAFPGPLTATSALTENNSGYEQDINLEIPGYWMQGTTGGLELGAWSQLTNSTARSLASVQFYGPLGGPVDGLGWIFPGWNRVAAQLPISSMRRSWRLPPGAGGVMAERWMYHRMQARKWSREGTRGWLPGKVGLLDVATRESGFYILPLPTPNEVRPLERLTQMLNDAYSGSSACGLSLEELRSFSGSEPIEVVGQETPIYFYPKLPR